MNATIARRYALDCAERIRHLMADPRSAAALDTVRRHLAGEASDEELATAHAAALSAGKEINQEITLERKWSTEQFARREASMAAACVSNENPYSAANGASFEAFSAVGWEAGPCHQSRADATNREKDWQDAHLVNLTEGNAP